MAESSTVALGKVIGLLDAYKAKAAFWAPFVLTLGTTLAHWAVTGEFNESELRVAIGGVIASVTAAVATYLAPAGDAEVALEPGAVEITDVDQDSSTYETNEEEE